MASDASCLPLIAAVLSAANEVELVAAFAAHTSVGALHGSRLRVILVSRNTAGHTPVSDSAAPIIMVSTPP